MTKSEREAQKIADDFIAHELKHNPWQMCFHVDQSRWMITVEGKLIDFELSHLCNCKSSTTRGRRKG